MPRNLVFGAEQQRKPDNSAKWIWLPHDKWPDLQSSRVSVFEEDSSVKGTQICAFQKTFTITKADRASLVMTADSVYTAYMNGTRIGSGPARVGGDYANTEAPNWWFYDEYDVGELLQEGENVLSVEAQLGPVRQYDYSVGRGGLLVDLLIGPDGDGEEQKCHVVSDESWSCEPLFAWQGTRYLDERSLPCGWPQSELNGADVAHAESLRVAPWRLRSSEQTALRTLTVHPGALIAPFAVQSRRIEENPGDNGDLGFRIVHGGPCTFWIDYGRIYAARLAIEATASNEGAKVEFELQEVAGRTDKNGAPEILILGGGKNSFHSLELHSGRYLKVTVSNMAEDVYFTQIDLISETYFGRQIGSFNCSSRELNDAYATSVWVDSLCGQSIHLDSPVHQEGLGCIGDYLIESLVDAYAFGDQTLARADIKRTALLLRQKNGVMFHTSYALLWISMVRNYWQLTGDADLVREVIDCVQLLLARYHKYVGASGLIEDAPNYMFIDWVKVGPYNLHHPPRFLGQGSMTAFYIGALNSAQELFDVLGLMSDHDVAAQRARDATDAFRRLLWRKDQGYFCDGLLGSPSRPPTKWLPTDSGKSESFSQHTQVLAIANGISSDAEAKELLRRALWDQALVQMQPYFLHFAFEAAARCGLTNELAEDLFARWRAGALEVPGGLKEMAGADSQMNCDYSHGWCGTPGYQLPARVVGIEPMSPGFTVAKIAPNLGTLKWAEAQVPTPLGLIDARFQRDDVSRSVIGVLSIPPQMEVALVVDGVGATGNVRIDGVSQEGNFYRIKSSTQASVHAVVIGEVQEV